MRYYKLSDAERFFRVDDTVSESSDRGKTWSRSKLTAHDIAMFHGTGLMEDTNQYDLKKPVTKRNQHPSA